MADIIKTRVQLVERAATELGRLVSGQNLETEDSDTIDTLVDPLLAQLSSDNVVSIDDDDAIDLIYFLPVARLLANEAGPSFGIPKSQDIKAADEALLRKLSSARPTLETLKVDYF